jgi:fused signal recognition particle receptor
MSEFRKPDNQSIDNREVDNREVDRQDPDSQDSDRQKLDSVDHKKPKLFERLRKSRGSAGNLPAEKPAGEQTMGGSVEAKPAFMARLKSRLKKTRGGLVGGLANLFRNKHAIDDEVLEELETRLLLADVGVESTTAIIGRLRERVSRQRLTDVEALLGVLREEMLHILGPNDRPLHIPEGQRPFVILMVGVNGVGKTTTIGKLARRLQSEGKSVLLAAGDTFRAAAVEQLQVWGERNQVTVIAQHTGADSASVIYDAMQAARARKVDVVIADTAGRLHTKANLMEELKKIHRVIGKLDPAAPHEVMLVVDAGTGQNALSQAVQFHAAVPLSSITLTKLDGTARGGIIFAITNRLGLPIRFIGVGEGVEDLQPFQPEEFVTALLSKDTDLE